MAASLQPILDISDSVLASIYKRSTDITLLCRITLNQITIVVRYIAFYLINLMENAKGSIKQMHRLKKVIPF